MIKLPPDHPLRDYVNLEMHARPADALRAPLRISYLALFPESDSRDLEWRQLRELVERFGQSLPATTLNHFSADLGPFRLRWERHTEFVRYTFFVPGDGSGLDGPKALEAVPQDWLAGLGGRTMVATHASLEPFDEDRFDTDAIGARCFAGNPLIGASVKDGAAIALTDFRVHEDGFSRLLILDHGLTARQAGRLTQALLELETYRLLALLALPVARELSPQLGQYEQELTAVTAALTTSSEADEAPLLDRLTRLEAELESRGSAARFRFDAAGAYYDLVTRRIVDLRETRLRGLPTFREFIDRRLAPAMHTCSAARSRLESLAERVARANELLATRVDITREKQNQELLTSMNRRAQAQLRLQQTVEGLSIAAVTYYMSGLVGYVAKGLKSAGLAVDPELAIAIAVPLIALLLWRGVRRMRRRLHDR
jgi:uncharacterized membrane-anchored protein